MRWLVLALAACATPSAPAIESRCAVPAVVASKPPIRYLDLVAMPPLPEKRGFDRIEERACRAQYEHVKRMPYQPLVVELDEMHRLVRLAVDAGGDCRIDTDAMLAAQASYHIGGCRGPSADEAFGSWVRLAAVASTRARRAAALRNVASLAWRIARSSGDSVDAWIDVGDRFVRAADADPNALVLSIAAVEAYERALSRASRDAMKKIRRRLERIVDGSAGDRARALRERLP